MGTRIGEERDHLGLRVVLLRFRYHGRFPVGVAMPNGPQSEAKFNLADARLAAKSQNRTPEDPMRSGVFDYLPQERIVYGTPAAEAVLAEAERLGKSRLFVLSTRSVSRKTDVVDAIRTALGDRFVGLYDECSEHTPRPTVIAAADAVREADADLIVTVGGGSAVDTGKVLQVCLAHDVRDTKAMDDWHLRVDKDGNRVTPEVAPSPVRQIIVPTTLSGAEFSSLGGSADPERGEKHGYYGRDICGQVVILDPAVTVHTPDWLWLSTGIRAVDHAVEGLCSIDGNPYIDGLCLHSLRLFARSLPQTKNDPQDLDARLECQQGVWMAASGINAVNYGASHGIGHALGGVAGVPHGHTSCVMLPAVMQWNLEATQERQQWISQAFGQPNRAAHELVGELIAGLDQPRTLRDIGIREDQLDRIAEVALKNFWVRTNPRRIETTDQIREILELAW
jgi:alcohol dehydrogenase class IV